VAAIGAKPAVAEKALDLDYEISVMAARIQPAKSAAFPPRVSS